MQNKTLPEQPLVPLWTKRRYQKKKRKNKQGVQCNIGHSIFILKYDPSKKDRKVLLLNIRRAMQSQNTAKFFKVQCKTYSFIPGIKFVRAVNDSHCLAHLPLLFLQTIKWKSDMNQIKDLQHGKNQTKGFIWLSGWLISEDLWIWVWGTV